MKTFEILLFSIPLLFTLSSCSGGIKTNQAPPADPNSSDVKTVAAVENPAVTLVITPAKGSLGGGYSVLLIGTGFTAGTTVKIAGNSCSSLQILSLNQISCTVPAAATAGAADIVTKTASGITSTFPSAFTYATDAFSSLTLLAGSLDPSGSANGIGAQVRFSTPRGITSDGISLFVLDQANQVIRAIQLSTGQVSIFAGTLGVAGNLDGIGQVARFYNPQFITIDPALVNLYVTDGQHTIRQINIGSQQVTTIAGSYPTSSAGYIDGPGLSARFRNPYGIVTDGFYLYVADGLNHAIRRIDLTAPGFTVSTIAAPPPPSVPTPGTTDGPGAGARFNTPAGIALNGTELYVADYNNNRIRKIDLSVPAYTVSTFAGTTTAGLLDGTGTGARLNGPNDIFASGGFLYVADYRNAAIRQISIATAAVTIIAGSYPQVMAGSADGIGTLARFLNPACLTVVATKIFVSDGNQSIRQVNIPTAAVTTFAGVAAPSGFQDGTGTNARFTAPKGGALYNGTLYVTDSGTYTVRGISLASGAVSTIAGTPLSSGSTNGTPFLGRFANPYGITVDPASGTLYVSELNHVIRKVNSSNGEISTILGTAGVLGTLDDTGSAARFNQPYGIVFVNGFLYITDTVNHSIRKVDLLTMAVTTLAGLTGTAGALDGVAGAARFNSPRGIAVDLAMLNLYVADTSNHAIRQINIASGTVTTFAGVLGAASYSDGVGNTARLYNPWAMTGDGNNLYIYDNTYCLVRKLNLATKAVTTLVGNPSVVACNDLDGSLDVARTAHPFGMLWSAQGMFLFGNHGVRLLK